MDQWAVRYKISGISWIALLVPQIHCRELVKTNQSLLKLTSRQLAMLTFLIPGMWVGCGDDIIYAPTKKNLYPVLKSEKRKYE